MGEWHVTESTRSIQFLAPWMEEWSVRSIFLLVGVNHKAQMVLIFINRFTLLLHRKKTLFSSGKNSVFIFKFDHFTKMSFSNWSLIQMEPIKQRLLNVFLCLLLHRMVVSLNYWSLGGELESHRSHFDIEYFVEYLISSIQSIFQIKIRTIQKFNKNIMTLTFPMTNNKICV